MDLPIVPIVIAVVIVGIGLWERTRRGGRTDPRHIDPEKVRQGVAEIDARHQHPPTQIPGGR